MKIADFFDRIFCINLSTRPDRWDNVQREFSRIGIMDKVERFEAITNALPTKGIALSHIACCQLAKDSGCKNYLVFEDDVLFINNTVKVIESALEELKDRSWNLFYWGGNICRPCYQIDNNLAELTHAQSTHAFAMHKNLFDTFLGYKNDFLNGEIVDLTLANKVIPRYSSYITIPMVAIQKADFSNIEGRYVDYTQWMEKRFYEQLVRKS